MASARSIPREETIDPAILIAGVTKAFPRTYGMLEWLKARGRIERRVVLRDVSLQVPRGELLGLLGANGAGKTTLLKLLATLAIPDRGRICVDGVDVAAAPLEARRRISICSGSERSFYYRFTARANLEFFGTLAGLEGAQLRRRVDESLGFVDLRAHENERYSNFSTGMRQRLAVARSLLADPPILLFDEPTRAVDPAHAASLRSLIRDRLVGQLGKTVVLATNLLEEAWELCDRVAVLHDGRLAALDSPERLTEGMTAPRYRIVLDHVDDAFLERARAVAGIKSLVVGTGNEARTVTVEFAAAGTSLTPLLRAISANGTSVFSVSPEPARPADVFAHLMESARG